MTAPRIDTTRNAIDGLILLLDDLRAELHDIHDLAYTRPRAADEARVKGGSRDYALDTHGDMEARRLLKLTAAQVVKTAGVMEDAIKAVRSHITAGGAVSGFDRTKVAPKHEVAAAISAAKRRRARGETWETVHHRIAPQPMIAFVEPTAELEALRGALVKMCSGVKPDRSRLTPVEQDAWRRAVNMEARTG